MATHNPAEPEPPVRRTQAEWDLFFYRMAAYVAILSKDPERKVGAVLVTRDRRQMSMGYNGFPAHVPDLPRLLADREYKLDHMVHAEVNCLRQSPFPAMGCTLYSTTFPCHRCAEVVAGSGAVRLVAPHPDLGHPRWGGSWRKTLEMVTASPWLTFVPVIDPQ